MRPQEYMANGSSAALSVSNHRSAQTDAACEWLTLEHLARDSERIGGMVVRSAQHAAGAEDDRAAGALQGDGA